MMSRCSFSILTSSLVQVFLRCSFKKVPHRLKLPLVKLSEIVFCHYFNSSHDFYTFYLCYSQTMLTNIPDDISDPALPKYRLSSADCNRFSRSAFFLRFCFGKICTHLHQIPRLQCVRSNSPEFPHTFLSLQSQQLFHIVLIPPFALCPVTITVAAVAVFVC